MAVKLSIDILVLGTYVFSHVHSLQMLKNTFKMDNVQKINKSCNVTDIYNFLPVEQIKNCTVMENTIFVT